MKKRGLSTIVATLIIILLVLVAIAIVWTVINNVVTRSSKQITIDPFTNNMEIKEAKVGLLNARVKLMRTVGNAELTSIKFIFTGGTKSYVYEERAPQLKELEIKTFTIPLEDISGIKSVSVIPVFGETIGLETKREVSALDIDYSIENNLIAYYKFDGNAKDSSGNEYDGVCTGNVCPLYTAGKVLQSADFDGVNDVVEDSQISANVFSGSYSVSVWFKFDDWTHDTRAIVQKRNLVGLAGPSLIANLILGINKPATVIYQNTEDPCTYTNTANKIGYMFGEYLTGARCGKWIFSQTEIQPGTWYHVVALYNSSNGEAKLYVDGALEGSETVNILPTSMSNLAIGGKPAGVTTNWEFLNGQIDELVIFSKALSEAEIMQIANL